MSDKAVSWRPINGWESLYEVSDRGEVRSLGRTIVQIRRGRSVSITFRPKRLRPWTDNGYPRVNLKGGGRKEKAYVHHLVCTAFHGPRPEGHEVAHGDGSRTNNSADKLRWASRFDNIQDKSVHGTERCRTTYKHARLEKGDAEDALFLSNMGMSARQIAREYAVCRSTIAYAFRQIRAREGAWRG